MPVLMYFQDVRPPPTHTRSLPHDMPTDYHLPSTHDILPHWVNSVIDNMEFPSVRLFLWYIDGLKKCKDPSSDAGEYSFLSSRAGEFIRAVANQHWLALEDRMLTTVPSLRNSGERPWAWSTWPCKEVICPIENWVTPALTLTADGRNSYLLDPECVT